ncbi:hypothetical protein RhiirA1_454914 [Rhizophagus irregularis]|uniref:Uncharacterized protein n=1 Tax=Rhizophagus irregularis TaxID=588596 RepID=A0A2N0S440_9GLOM|nr:hypothetical protein RhiirA1_454914 [Rhizophagus irregularis]
MSDIIDFTSTSANKLIADINKKIAEEKKLNGPEQKVVKITLLQIDPKVCFDVLDSIYNFFQADRIGEDLYIKFDSGEKEDIYDELRSLLKEQLPEWWFQEKRFLFIYNCPPPQIWIEVAYNITDDCERDCIPLNSCPSLAPYIGYWPSNEVYDRVSWHDIVWNQHLSIGYEKNKKSPNTLDLKSVFEEVLLSKNCQTLENLPILNLKELPALDPPFPEEVLENFLKNLNEYLDVFTKVVIINESMSHAYINFFMITAIRHYGWYQKTTLHKKKSLRKVKVAKPFKIGTETY